MLDIRSVEKLWSIKENLDFCVKPMSNYEISRIRYDDIRIGEDLILNLDMVKDEKILLSSGDVTAEMSIWDYTNAPISNVSLYKTVLSNVGKNVIGRVADIEADGRIILERKSVEKESIKYLRDNLGKVISAEIINFYEYGVFMDIGNGVISFVHVKEFSKARWNNLERFYKIGDFVKVKLLDCDEENKFFLSRKQAYTQEDMMKKYPSGYSCVVTCNSWVPSNDGMFVEFDPGNVGIMDVPANFPTNTIKEGDRVLVFLKKYKENGFKCTFLRKMS